MEKAAPRSPIVTLTTDFGTEDHYVGTMKGVILSRCPEAQVVDISHGVKAFSIYSGAYTIDQAAWYFPPGTVHVVVVDPGVGTSRRALVAESRGHLFVAPDNGVLSLVLSRDPETRQFEADNPAYWLPSPSQTFHGRDIFAPLAAALASGAAQPQDMGALITDVQLLPELHVNQTKPNTWTGKILSVDHFGNLITNFAVSDFSDICTTPFRFESSGHRIDVFCRTFADAPPNTCIAYFGSSGFIEFGFDRQNAARILGVESGSSVQLTLPDMQGM